MARGLGPGALVAAAFVGPGTVTACTLAGAGFGFSLLWVLAFATLATIALQDMAARLGAGAGLGLGEALRRSAGGPVRLAIVTALAVSALAVGNAAYEAGNLAGGALGLAALTGEDGARALGVVLIAAAAGAALIHGRYRSLERLLVGAVVVMSLAFGASALLARPDLSALFAGLVPRLPEGGLFTAIALFGTTIVPYNLFLHAAAAKARWGGGPREIAKSRAARREAALSIGLGGLVSMGILATAAAGLYGAGVTVEGAGEMALALEPAFGPLARILIGAGLLAAGLTSAITAPMATAYAMGELFGEDEAARRWLFRPVALGILLIGAVTALSGIRPVSLILFAQVANGLLLPLAAGFLLWVMNRRALLGAAVNGPVSNVMGALVLLVTAGLGLRAVLRAFGVWP